MDNVDLAPGRAALVEALRARGDGRAAGDHGSRPDADGLLTGGTK